MNILHALWLAAVDSMLDPIRRRQVLGRVAETAVPAFLITWSLWQTAAIVFGEFLFYELVLEKVGVVGHYWERGPRDGETFTRP